MSFVEIILRIAITFILSLIFGIERQKSHKPIGFGTFIFVAVGACNLAIIATLMDQANPLPLLGAIVTGIGFLGAGALIKTSDKIFGFTSAASIWLFAILGLSFGIGQYLLGISIYLIIIIVTQIDKVLEKKGVGSHRIKLFISTNTIISEREIRTSLMLFSKKLRLLYVDVNKKENSMSFSYLVEGTREQVNKIPNVLFGKKWFASCKIE